MHLHTPQNQIYFFAYAGHVTYLPIDLPPLSNTHILTLICCSPSPRTANYTAATSCRTDPDPSL